MIRVDIEFTRPTGFKPISWLIRLFEGSKYSHVRLSWFVASDIRMIYEASGSEVKFLDPKSDTAENCKIIKEYYINLKPEEYQLFVLKCVEMSGIKYGRLQLIGMALARILHKRFNLFADKKKSMVCSELVYYLLNDILKINLKFNPELDGPRELDLALDLCKDNKKLVLVKEN